MPKGQTVAFSLYENHIETLDELAKEHGNRSRALQWVLETFRRVLVYRELDEAYQAYYENPDAADADHALTLELLSQANWPESPSK